MKSLHEIPQQEEIRTRLQTLDTWSERQWGKMDSAQALAHCASAMEMALGDLKPPRVLIGRVLGGLVKSFALGDDKPFKRNSPTAPELVIADQREFDVEKQRLSNLINRFVAGGPAACTTHPHAFFGKLTPAQWGVLEYKHLDHHLRQFGV